MGKLRRWWWLEYKMHVLEINNWADSLRWDWTLSNYAHTSWLVFHETRHTWSKSSYAVIHCQFVDMFLWNSTRIILHLGWSTSNLMALIFKTRTTIATTVGSSSLPFTTRKWRNRTFTRWGNWRGVARSELVPWISSYIRSDFTAVWLCCVMVKLIA